MTYYSNIPMIRLVIPFMAGVILFANLQFHLPLWIILSLISVFIISYFLNGVFFQADYHYRWFYGVNITLFLIVCGYLAAQFRYEPKHPLHYSRIIDEETLLRVRMTEPVSEKTNSFQIVGKVTHVYNNGTPLKTLGKILIYLEKDTMVQNLKYGDVLFISGQPQEVQSPKNPDAFNYKKFLANQNIFHQAYRRSGQWYYSGINEGNPIISSAHQLREIALHTLQMNNITGKEFSVVSALLLGYREYLDEDLQREFAGAGAMHILCVSGLHVGIIFIALNFLFSFLHKLPAGYFLKTIIIVFLIWFYAAITGFSPSVLRASTMFSFVAIGQSFRRSTNIYNTLAASAFILILADPLIITRIGFQLSYIAVLSIVALQPFLYRQIYFKNFVADKAWAIITVSLAAQLGTGPLGLFYFNQFPNYFLLTNLIVIPLSGLIINTGLIFFFLSPVSFLAAIAGKILSWFVYVLHVSVRFIESLPFSTTQNIYLNLTDSLLIFIILASLGFVLIQKSKKAIWWSLISLLILATSISIRQINNYAGQKLVVYHMPNATAIDFISGKNCYFWACENALENPGNLAFNISGHRVKKGLASKKPLILNHGIPESQPVSEYLLISGSFLQFNDQLIKILGERNEPLSGLGLTDTLDLIIIRNNPRHSIQEIIHSYPTRRIVFDSSNSIMRSERWLAQCDSFGLDCWSVRHQGAFELNVKKW